MKSREEFKRSIYEKRDRYFIKKKAARKKRMMTLLPVVALVFVFGIGVLPRLLNQSDISTDSYTESAVVDGAGILSVAISRYPSNDLIKERDAVGEKDEDVKKLGDFFDTLSFGESVDESGDGLEENYPLDGYILRLTYGDGVEMTVLCFKNRVIAINDIYHTLTTAQADRLFRLIDALIE
ncbi:MAG: hypothetical protein GX303_07855 [Clostridiales bacterium]|nr:hypothetical protein [Clostridiales bacterium]